MIVAAYIVTLLAYLFTLMTLMAATRAPAMKLSYHAALCVLLVGVSIFLWRSV